MMWRHLGDDATWTSTTTTPQHLIRLQYPVCVRCAIPISNDRATVGSPLNTIKMALTPPIAGQQSFSCGKHAHSIMYRKDSEGATSPGPVYMSSSQMSM